MGATRSITYASVSDMDGAKAIYSGAETWGDLRAENADIDAKALKMKPWIKVGTEVGEGVTGNSYRLPAGDFKIVFLVDKNDSGNN